MATQKAVTLTDPYGFARVSGVEVCVTAFKTPAAVTANTARAAFTEIQRDPRLPRISADVRHNHASLTTVVYTS